MKMLHVKNIKKSYQVGEVEFSALKGVDIAFRKKEFVAILGQSGSGKTTLLNILGGLDRYSDGDLIIDGISTKNYKDRDWDTYRNHRVGFVFQSYNLIPHLSVLGNVELALTLSGVSAEERKQKATDVLTTVGLKEHLDKRPNQLSGGQQQRVAIARALVNDPNIILADEPTGALDTETSIEIMELLTQISHNKLIIMVTHNPELAKKYAERIIKLQDGLVIADTNPYKETTTPSQLETNKKTAMSFFTALKLSFKNLLTKKFRTIITAVAGSIGIIGVALVLSLQYGVGKYIDDMQAETFAGFPIIVAKRTQDLSAVMQPPKDIKTIENGIGGYTPEPPQVIVTNEITQEFVQYVNQYVEPKADSVIRIYGYEGRYFRKNSDGTLLEYQPAQVLGMGGMSAVDFIKQPTVGKDFLNKQFTIVAGQLYDSSKNEAVLVVNSYNQIPNYILKYLGLPENQVVSYDEIINKTFKVYDNNHYFTKNNQNIYEKQNNEDLLSYYEQAPEVSIVGIIKVNSKMVSIDEGIYYSEKVRDDIFAANTQSEIVGAQKNTPTINVQTGMTILPQVYETLISDLGGSDIPDSFMFYSANYDNKEELNALLKAYNDQLPSGHKEIKAVDNAETALSMIKTMTNMITAVLIAFAGISLVVSSVMIGIITYTSVLERTKEIGVLRSIGARKKDISRVFNAETLIIGLIAGLIGVGFTYAVLPIINLLLAEATETSSIAQLYWLHALILIAISMGLTFIAGLIPARIASQKDPVVALRTE